MDSQATALYKAQADVFCLTDHHRVIDEKQCIAFVGQVFGKAWEAKLLPKKYLPIVDIVDSFDHIEGVASATAGLASWCVNGTMTPRISLKQDSGMRSWVIAHECSHLILCSGRGKRADLWEHHGKEFATVMLWVVEIAFGSYMREALKASFMLHGVEYLNTLKGRQ